MSLTTIGVEPVRRNLADLTYQIMTQRASFIIERYGRPVAYLGPASTPTVLTEAAERLEALRDARLEAGGGDITRDSIAYELDLVAAILRCAAG